MIRSFADLSTRLLWERQRVRHFPPALTRVMLRKLRYLDTAVRIGDLAAPPGNHLEKLRGNREGHYSIRINRQWRLCFRWSGKDAFDVAIVDYH